MLKDQNFVKRLASCEIMGTANNICSDKTGTLTMNKMVLTNFFLETDKLVKVHDAKYQMSDFTTCQQVQDLLIQSICCNTSGSMEEASATEQAMLQMMEKLDVDFEKVRSDHLPLDFIRFHFTSKRKRMSTIIENCGKTEHNYDKRILMKGASEFILGSCNYYFDEDGTKHELTPEKREELKKQIVRYASNALRTIVFAVKDLKPNEGGPQHDDMDKDGVIHEVEREGFTLVALVGIKDIIRPEVPDAVRACQGAGIYVRMVTGDNKITAMAIAKECHIIDEAQSKLEDSVLEGPEFYEKLGGLYCKECKQDSPCDCPPEKV